MFLVGTFSGATGIAGRYPAFSPGEGRGVRAAWLERAAAGPVLPPAPVFRWTGSPRSSEREEGQTPMRALRPRRGSGMLRPNRFCRLPRLSAGGESLLSEREKIRRPCGSGGRGGARGWCGRWRISRSSAGRRSNAHAGPEAAEGFGDGAVDVGQVGDHCAGRGVEAGHLGGGLFGSQNASHGLVVAAGLEMDPGYVDLVVCPSLGDQGVPALQREEGQTPMRVRRPRRGSGMVRRTSVKWVTTVRAEGWKRVIWGAVRSAWRRRVRALS